MSYAVVNATTQRVLARNYPLHQARSYAHDRSLELHGKFSVVHEATGTERCCFCGGRKHRSYATAYGLNMRSRPPEVRAAYFRKVLAGVAS
jgi:hypothetical protein